MNRSINKSLFFTVIFFCFCFQLNAIKFFLKDKNNNEITVQAIFDSGVSAKGVSDGYGITDYLSIFLKGAFHFQDFGVGFVFDFRFRFVNNRLSFVTNNWYLPKNYYNSILNTFFLYIDKIEYVVYGKKDDPFYLKVGRLPLINFGSGFLVKDFHNWSFEPVEKEQGIYFKFTGKNLDKVKLFKLPLEGTFFITDILDPDIFSFDLNIDVLYFTSFRDLYYLKIGNTFITDINATESNRISGLKKDLSSIDNSELSLERRLTSHRNLTTSFFNYLTSFPLFYSLYAVFNYPHKYFKLDIFNENVFLFDFRKEFGFGGGTRISSETKLINLRNSGFLLGIITGFILESPHFFIDYFSSNYEILRVKQYKRLYDKERFTPFVEAGFSINGLKEKIRFLTVLKMPIQEVFASRFTIKFILDETVVKGLSIALFYETGVNAMYIMGTEGTGFIDSITRDFRFYGEATLKFYSARFTLQVGIQRPAWCIPEIPNLLPGQINAFEYLAKGGTIKYDEIEKIAYFYNPKTKQYEQNYVYNWNMNFDQYKNELQKFVRLEIAFVF